MRREHVPYAKGAFVNALCPGITPYPRSKAALSPGAIGWHVCLWADTGAAGMPKDRRARTQRRVLFHPPPYRALSCLCFHSTRAYTSGHRTHVPRLHALLALRTDGEGLQHYTCQLRCRRHLHTCKYSVLMCTCIVLLAGQHFHLCLLSQQRLASRPPPSTLAACTHGTGSTRRPAAAADLWRSCCPCNA